MVNTLGVQTTSDHNVPGGKNGGHILNVPQFVTPMCLVSKNQVHSKCAWSCDLNVFGGHIHNVFQMCSIFVITF